MLQKENSKRNENLRKTTCCSDRESSTWISIAIKADFVTVKVPPNPQ